MLNVFLLSDQVRMKSNTKWSLLLYPKMLEDPFGEFKPCDLPMCTFESNKNRERERDRGNRNNKEKWRGFAHFDFL